MGRGRMVKTRDGRTARRLGDKMNSYEATMHDKFNDF